MCKNCEFRDLFWSYHNVESLPACNEMSTSDTRERVVKNKKPNFQQAVGSLWSHLMPQWIPVALLCMIVILKEGKQGSRLEGD